MNSKAISIISIVVVIVLGGLGFLLFKNYSQQTQQQPDNSEMVVKDTVVGFGTQLKSVSLLAPDAAQQIEQKYGPYVAADLLAQWKQNPSSAPGKVTSSPWPDRIEITSADKNTDGTYTVKGNIVEVTSQEATNGGAVNMVPVTIGLKMENNAWRIYSFVQQQPAPQQTPASLNDLIQVSAPLPNQIINSPLTVTGKARGNWFFEASAPIKLIDANGKLVAQSHIQAQGSWMTNDYVPFTVTLTFSQPATTTGTLILQNDNPSGLPENSKELRIPVKFK